MSTRPNIITRKQELPLKDDSSTLFLKVMISIAVFLFAVTLAGVLSINSMLLNWNQSILGSLTVQIMPVKLDPLQQFFHAFAHFALFHAADAQGQGHVVEGRQMVEQAEVLKHDADFAAQHRQAVTVGEVDVFAEDVDNAAARFLCQIHHAQQ